MKGEPTFASRIEQDSWVGLDGGTWQENKDKEQNEQDTRYRERDRHIAVSGHSGIHVGTYGAPCTASVPEPMPVCKHVKSAAGCPLVQASSSVLFASSQSISHHSSRKVVVNSARASTASQYTHPFEKRLSVITSSFSPAQHKETPASGNSAPCLARSFSHPRQGGSAPP